MIECYG